MISLANTQQQLRDALLLNKEGLLQSIHEKFIPSSERFKAYKLNVFKTLTRHLQKTFPSVWELMGDEWFTSLSYDYIETFPPTSGTLNEWGESFANFLSTFDPAKHLSYLKDIAYLDWIKHNSYYAKNAVPLDLTRLQLIASQDIEALLFTFHPSFYLFQSSYPIDQIIKVMEKNHHNNLVDIKAGSCFSVVCRPFQKVEISWISQSTHTFLGTLQQGSTLSNAHMCAQYIDRNFDVEENLVFAFRHNLLVDISTMALRSL
jgi:hypothetical protein